MQGTVTKLERQKRRKTRVSVFLDEEYAFSLEELTAAKLQLGQFLGESEIAALQGEDEANRAQERALGLLEHRPRGRFELQQRLRRADFSDGAIEEALARLEQVELVDDRAFAKFWVEQRLTFRPRGKRALRYELRRRGVGGEAINRALQGVSDAESAEALVARRLQRMVGWQEDREKAKDGLFALLRNRGFDYHTIKEALDQVMGAESEPEGLDNPIEDE